MKITVISKSSSPVCRYLMEWLDTLPEEMQENIAILDDNSSSLQDLHRALAEFDTMGFPSIVLHGEKGADGHTRVLSGFAEVSKPIIEKHLSC